MLVIGIGNRFRGDDETGLVAAERIRSKARPGVNVALVEKDPSCIIDLWDRSTPFVVIIDACQSDAPAGTIRKMEINKATDLTDFKAPRFFSSHSLGLSEILQLAKTLECLPQRLAIYAIDGKRFSLGEPMSPENQEAAKMVAEQILAELQPLHQIQA